MVLAWHTARWLYYPSLFITDANFALSAIPLSSKSCTKEKKQGNCQALCFLFSFLLPSHHSLAVQLGEKGWRGTFGSRELSDPRLDELKLLQRMWEITDSMTMFFLLSPWSKLPSVFSRVRTPYLPYLEWEITISYWFFKTVSTSQKGQPFKFASMLYFGALNCVKQIQQIEPYLSVGFKTHTSQSHHSAISFSVFIDFLKNIALKFPGLDSVTKLCPLTTFLGL